MSDSIHVFDPPDPRADPIGFVDEFVRYMSENYSGLPLDDHLHVAMMGHSNLLLEEYGLAVHHVISYRDGSIQPHFKRL